MRNLFWHEYDSPGTFHPNVAISDEATWTVSDGCEFTFHWAQAPSATTPPSPGAGLPDLDALGRYELITYSGSQYICDDATGIYSGWNDYDCERFNGGSPPYSIYPELMCTHGWSWECNTEYYPSEMENRFFSTINGGNYVCEDTWQGSECWRYNGGHPEAAVTPHFPDYYCNYDGCGSDDYP